MNSRKRKNDENPDGSAGLPPEILETVFSSLSIPELCNVQLVCKDWKNVTAQPTFHKLWDDNYKLDNSIFMWRVEYESTPWGPISSGGFAFFDMDAERWYSVSPSKLSGSSTRSIARLLDVDARSLFTPMCEHDQEGKWHVFLWDPVAMTKTTLPDPPSIRIRPVPKFTKQPVVVCSVDNVSPDGKLKIFLFNRLSNAPPERSFSGGAYVHELGSNEWQFVENIPSVYDAICFQNRVLAVRKIKQGGSYDQLQILQNEKGNRSFEEVWRMPFARVITDAHLYARHGRLFVGLYTRVRFGSLKLDFPCPNSESVFPDSNLDLSLWFEVYEVLLASGSLKKVANLNVGNLMRTFDGEGICSWEMFPCVDEKGKCTSLVFTHEFEGKMLRYHVDTGKMDVLPSHPSADIVPLSDDNYSIFSCMATKWKSGDSSHSESPALDTTSIPKLSFR